MYQFVLPHLYEYSPSYRVLAVTDFGYITHGVTHISVLAHCMLGDEGRWTGRPTVISTLSHSAPRVRVDAQPGPLLTHPSHSAAGVTSQRRTVTSTRIQTTLSSVCLTNADTSSYV